MSSLGCPIDLSDLIYPKLNSWSPPPNSLYNLSHLSYGNSIIHVAQAKTLTLSLNLFFVSLLHSHIQSVTRPSWLYFQILYQRADHFLCPPPLPLWTKLRLSFTWVTPEAFVQPSCFYPSLSLSLSHLLYTNHINIIAPPPQYSIMLLSQGFWLAIPNAMPSLHNHT